MNKFIDVVRKTEVTKDFFGITSYFASLNLQDARTEKEEDQRLLIEAVIPKFLSDALYVHIQKSVQYRNTLLHCLIAVFPSIESYSKANESIKMNLDDCHKRLKKINSELEAKRTEILKLKQQDPNINIKLQINMLEAQVKKLKDQLEKEIGLKNRFRDQNTLHQNQVKKFDEERKILVDQLSNVHKQNTERMRKEAEEKLLKLRTEAETEVEKLRDHAKQVLRQLDAANEKAGHCQVETDAANKLAEGLKVTNEDLKESERKIKEQLTQYMRRCEENEKMQENKLWEAQEKAVTHTLDIQDLEVDIKMKEQLLSNAQLQIEKLRNEINELRNNLPQHEQKLLDTHDKGIKELTERMENIYADNTKLQKSINKLETATITKDQKITQLEAKIVQLETESTSLSNLRNDRIEKELEKKILELQNSISIGFNETEENVLQFENDNLKKLNALLVQQLQLKSANEIRITDPDMNEKQMEEYVLQFENDNLKKLNALFVQQLKSADEITDPDLKSIEYEKQIEEYEKKLAERLVEYNLLKALHNKSEADREHMANKIATLTAVTDLIERGKIRLNNAQIEEAIKNFIKDTNELRAVNTNLQVSKFKLQEDLERLVFSFNACLGEAPESLRDIMAQLQLDTFMMQAYKKIINSLTTRIQSFSHQRKEMFNFVKFTHNEIEKLRNARPTRSSAAKIDEDAYKMLNNSFSLLRKLYDGLSDLLDENCVSNIEANILVCRYKSMAQYHQRIAEEYKQLSAKRLETIKRYNQEGVVDMEIIAEDTIIQKVNADRDIMFNKHLTCKSQLKRRQDIEGDIKKFIQYFAFIIEPDNSQAEVLRLIEETLKASNIIYNLRVRLQDCEERETENMEDYKKSEKQLKEYGNTCAHLEKTKQELNVLEISYVDLQKQLALCRDAIAKLEYENTRLNNLSHASVPVNAIHASVPNNNAIEIQTLERVVTEKEAVINSLQREFNEMKESMENALTELNDMRSKINYVEPRRYIPTNLMRLFNELRDDNFSIMFTELLYNFDYSKSLYPFQYSTGFLHCQKFNDAEIFSTRTYDMLTKIQKYLKMYQKAKLSATKNSQTNATPQKRLADKKLIAELNANLREIKALQANKEGTEEKQDAAQDTNQEGNLTKEPLTNDNTAATTQPKRNKRTINDANQVENTVEILDRKKPDKIRRTVRPSAPPTDIRDDVSDDTSSDSSDDGQYVVRAKSQVTPVKKNKRARDESISELSPRQDKRFISSRMSTPHKSPPELNFSSSDLSAIITDEEDTLLPNSGDEFIMDTGNNNTATSDIEELLDFEDDSESEYGKITKDTFTTAEPLTESNMEQVLSAFEAKRMAEMKRRRESAFEAKRTVETKRSSESSGEDDTSLKPFANSNSDNTVLKMPFASKSDNTVIDIENNIDLTLESSFEDSQSLIIEDPRAKKIKNEIINHQQQKYQPINESADVTDDETTERRFGITRRLAQEIDKFVVKSKSGEFFVDRVLSLNINIYWDDLYGKACAKNYWIRYEALNNNLEMMNDKFNITIPGSYVVFDVYKEFKVANLECIIFPHTPGIDVKKNMDMNQIYVSFMKMGFYIVTLIQGNQKSNPKYVLIDGNVLSFNCAKNFVNMTMTNKFYNKTAGDVLPYLLPYTSMFPDNFVVSIVNVPGDPRITGRELSDERNYKSRAVAAKGILSESLFNEATKLQELPTLFPDITFRRLYYMNEDHYMMTIEKNSKYFNKDNTGNCFYNCMQEMYEDFDLGFFSVSQLREEMALTFLNIWSTNGNVRDHSETRFSIMGIMSTVDELDLGFMNRFEEEDEDTKAERKIQQISADKERERLDKIREERLRKEKESGKN